MKDKSILSRFGIVILVLLALVLIFPSAKVDLASSIEASTQASVRVDLSLLMTNLYYFL